MRVSDEAAQPSGVGDGSVSRRDGLPRLSVMHAQPLEVLALQRQIGNAAVTALLSPRRLARQVPSATASPDLSCSWELREIAAFGGPAGPVPMARLARDITTAFTGCDTAYVQIDVAERSTGDDPHGDAISRAMSIREQLIRAIGAGRFAADRFDTGASFTEGQADPHAPEVVVVLGRRTPFSTRFPSISSSDPPGPIDPGPPRPAGQSQGSTPPASTTQVSGQAAFGYVSHYYTTPHGPNDALHEWLVQAVAASTAVMRAHGSGHEERQVLIQAQYSLSTGAFTLGFGGQESYVFALPRNLQLSFWAQLMAGRNLTAGTGQGSLSAGTQLLWQPADWLTVAAQVGTGPTVQPGGPTSIDSTGLIVFTIQH